MIEPAEKVSSKDDLIRLVYDHLAAEDTDALRREVEALHPADIANLIKFIQEFDVNKMMAAAGHLI